MDATGVLAQFIKYLEANKLVDFDILGDGDECFQNRFRIQKYVFLAGMYGLNLRFRYNLYIYGPYSRDLAKEYYKIANDRDRMYSQADSSPPQGLQSGDFLGIVNGKDQDWLEIATTLLDMYARFPKRGDLVESVRRIKSGFTYGFISNVLDGLVGINLVKSSP